MEGSSRKEEAWSPQLLDLIPKDRGWHVRKDQGKNHGSSDEKKLELRLAPPGQDVDMQNPEKKAFSTASAAANTAGAGHNGSSQKRYHSFFSLFLSCNYVFCTKDIHSQVALVRRGLDLA